MKFINPAWLTDAVDSEAVTEAVETVTEAAETVLTFGERISLGLQVLFFGMGVVFAVLILLWAILVVFRIVFYDIPSKKAKPTEEKLEPNDTVELPAVKESAPNPEELAAAIAAATACAAADEAELVAAITAAISLTLDKPQTAFRVVSFRRTASK